MLFSPAALLAALERDLPPGTGGKLCVAFSGGLDSTVLLHALAAIPNAYHRLRAIHIDHQLHRDSGKWRDHCEQTARSAGIPFSAEQVSVPLSSGVGLEAAARTVRYAALRRLLEPGEVLLTAQHADDQLETVLLALMRGAGVNGLSAMPACQPFGAGWHARPLLDFTRAELAAWASAEHWVWLSDPSNDNSQLSRNYLRHEVIPSLRRRWPDVATSGRRSAAHLGEAGRLLAELAVADLALAASGECLRVAVLRELDPARRRNLLRYWLRSLGARAPSTQKLAAVEHDMLSAQEDRTPWVQWEGFEVRRHRGLLYGHPPLPVLDPAAFTAEWDLRGPFELPAELGALRAESVNGGLAVGRLPLPLRVGFRRGGETLQRAGHAHRSELKKLLQDADVLPWWRERVPLLLAGRKVVAVGDLWIAEQFAARADEPGVRIVWQRKPPLIAVSRASACDEKI